MVIFRQPSRVRGRIERATREACDLESRPETFDGLLGDRDLGVGRRGEEPRDVRSGLSPVEKTAHPFDFDEDSIHRATSERRLGVDRHLEHGPHREPPRGRQLDRRTDFRSDRLDETQCSKPRLGVVTEID